MRPQCNVGELRIEGPGRREVVARFDGGRMSSDGGAVLLREADRIVGVTAKLASCFTDFRDPARVEHDLEALVAQRVYALALGYEDLNDHDVLRDDSVLALALGREDLTGAMRSRSRDLGHPLAGSTTLNRLELGDDATAAAHRYKRIVADGAALDAQMVALFVAMQATAPAEIVLDLDATDAPVHGAQEGRFFHGYYGCYCYLALYITCGDHVLRCRLRPAHVDAAAGAVDELATVVRQIRAHWPDTAIMVRADSGFCREALMSWCESHDVDFVLGVAKSSRLRARIARQLERSRRRCLARGKASRRYRSFRFRTLKSWSRSRRVVGKAEWLPGGNGANPRFVVTSLPAERFAARALYEDLYCARGDMENRIKEQQLDLFADRTSSSRMAANQLRLYFSAFAGILMQAIREFGVKGTALARAQFGTLRLRLLKIAGSIKVTARRVWLSLSSVHPWREPFVRVASNLQNARASPG